MLLVLGMTYGLVDWLKTPSQMDTCLSRDGSLLEEFQSLEVSVPQIVSIGATAELAVMDTSEAIEVPPQPVQPIEERGDAMLFEMDALQGTPFDDAITRPFD